MPTAENEAFEINLTFKWYYYSFMTLLLVPLTGQVCIREWTMKLLEVVNYTQGGSRQINGSNALL